MTGAADYMPDAGIDSYAEFRTTSLHPNGYFGVAWPEDNILPKEIWMKDKYKQFIIGYDDENYRYLAQKNAKNKPWEELWYEEPGSDQDFDLIKGWIDKKKDNYQKKWNPAAIRS